MMGTREVMHCAIQPDTTRVFAEGIERAFERRDDCQITLRSGRVCEGKLIAPSIRLRILNADSKSKSQLYPGSRTAYPLPSTTSRNASSSRSPHPHFGLYISFRVMFLGRIQANMSLLKQPRTRLGRSRSCRQAPQASRWSRSRWWTTSPPNQHGQVPSRLLWKGRYAILPQAGQPLLEAGYQLG